MFAIRKRKRDRCGLHLFQIRVTYGNLASLYTKANRFKEAQITVQKALDFNPNYLNGWLHLARAFSAEGDKVSAMRCVKRALDIDPASDDAKQLEDWLRQ